MAMVVGAGCGVGGGRRRGRCSGRCSRSGGCRRSGRRRGYRSCRGCFRPWWWLSLYIHWPNWMSLCGPRESA